MTGSSAPCFLPLLSFASFANPRTASIACLTNSHPPYLDIRDPQPPDSRRWLVMLTCARHDTSLTIRLPRGRRVSSRGRAYDHVLLRHFPLPPQILCGINSDLTSHGCTAHRRYPIGPVQSAPSPWRPTIAATIAAFRPAAPQAFAETTARDERATTAQRRWYGDSQVRITCPLLPRHLIDGYSGLKIYMRTPKLAHISSGKSIAPTFLHLRALFSTPLPVPPCPGRNTDFSVVRALACHIVIRLCLVCDIGPYTTTTNFEQ